MAAGLIVPISGPYLSVYNALPLGTLNDDGMELACTVQGQEVNESDAYGLSLVEAIHRGQNWRARLRGLEWNKTGLLSLLQMFGWSGAAMPGATATTLSPVLANIGDRWTKFMETLLLTSILGNPPATPQSLTAVNAGFAPNSQTVFNMTSKLREMPVELVLIPYSTVISSVTFNVPFTVT